LLHPFGITSSVLVKETTVLQPEFEVVAKFQSDPGVVLEHRNVKIAFVISLFSFPLITNAEAVAGSVKVTVFAVM
jgi:hypothetical protein